MNKLKTFLSKRLGFMTLLVFALWIKTVIAYYADVALGVSDPLQHLILIINPIATAVILFSFHPNTTYIVSLYRKKNSYTSRNLVAMRSTMSR